MDTKRASLEYRIFEMIQRTNSNTPHFDYKVNFGKGNFTLDLYTYNPKQNALHFLHSVTAERPDMCLVDMVIYLEQLDTIKKDRVPYVVTWQRKDNPKENVSYYFEESEQAVLEKFYFGKNKADYVKVDVEKSPQS